MLNFSEINFWASLQKDFLDFSFALIPVFMSLCIGSKVIEKHLVHSRTNELNRCRWSGLRLLSRGSHSVGVDLTASVIILIVELS